MARNRVADELVRALRDLGVRHVFGVPSGGWTDYMEAIRATDGIEFVLTSHEGGAGFMADVCGHLTDAPGVCFGTLGPGATNLSTGVGCALLDRAPVIALTDEIAVPMQGRTTQMGIDHQALFAPLTKRTLRLERRDVRGTVFEAARVALAERPGPVHIGLPIGLSGEDVERGGDDPFEGPARIPAAGPDALERMEALFRAARRPLLVAGLGAARAGVGARLRAVAERHGLPVVLTPMAKGLVPEDHPAYAGVLFHALSDLVGATHRQADLVIAVGYDPVEFDYEAWLPDAPLVNVDTVAAEPGGVVPECDVVGDIDVALSRLEALDGGATRWDLGALAERREALHARLAARDGALGPCAVLEALRRALPPSGIMTCDVGAHTHLIGQKWATPAPGLQIMTNGWSAMGFGIPAAIAAGLCRPDVPVCAVIGDGGLLMSAGELATAARLARPMVFVLLNDNDLALIRIKQQRKDYAVYGTALGSRIVYGDAGLFGVPILRAGNAGDLEAALTEAFARDGPVIVEAVIDSGEYDSLVLKKDRPPE